MRQKTTFPGNPPKYLRSTGIGKGKAAALAVVVCLLSILSAVTIAYLLDAEERVNTFAPAFVDCQVRETFDGITKSNVTVENTGTAPAYIRAIIVANWVGDAGTEKDGTVHYQMPIAGTDYSIRYGDGWKLHTDGYYYYVQPVNGNSSTGNLIDECTALQPGPVAGYHLEVEIVAEAVQSSGTNADGTKAVVLAWGVDPEALR